MSIDSTQEVSNCQTSLETPAPGIVENLDQQEMEGGPAIPQSQSVDASTQPSEPDDVDKAISELNEIQQGIYNVLISQGILPTEALCKVTVEYANFSHGPNVPGYFGQTLAYVGLKHDQALAILELSEEMASLEDQLHRIEQMLMRDIVDAVDPQGKSIYSNAEKRNAELTQRMNSIPAFIQLQEDIKTLRSDIETHKIEERYYSDLVSVYKSFASTL
jgi:hypothetical protein